MISKLFVLFFVGLAHSGQLSQSYDNPWTSYNPQTNAYGPQGVLYVPHVQEQHIPIIVNGVPVETREVQEAKAQHFAAVANARQLQAREWQRKNSYGNQYNTGSYQPAPIYVEPAWANGNTEGQGLYEPGVNGWNTYTDSSSQHGHRYRRSILSYGHQNQHVPIITSEGVPVETPEVIQAKALHQQAHENAKLSHNAWKSSQIVEDESAWQTPSQSVAWQPQTTGWENNAWQNANNGWTPKSAVSTVSYTVNHGNNYGWQKLSHQPQHVPVLDKNGVPFDTAEVQLARQQHLLAHQQAELNKWNNNGWQASNTGVSTQYLPVASEYHQQATSLTTSGVPVETPEVQVAKAQHLAAHQAEQAKHSAWAGSNYAGSYNYGAVAGYHGDSNSQTVAHGDVVASNAWVKHE